MAEGRKDVDWKEKYDNLDKSYTNLKKLAHKAVADYDDLLRKYDQNQKQYEELKQRLIDTEKQLSDLQNVLEPVCDEYSNLDHRYNLEKACRSEAEQYATKVVRENKQLKRQSQIFVQSLSSLNVDVTKMVDATENLADVSSEDQSVHLTAMIESLQEQVVELKHTLRKTEEEREEALELKKIAEKKLENEMQSAAWVRQTLEHHDSQMRQFKRVSLKAFDEYSVLVDKFENERRLKEEAERYASRMLSEREAMARESSALIGSAMANDQLRNALLQIEDLNKELESLRVTDMQKIRDLEKELEDTRDANQMTILENQLQAATEQISQLQKQISDTTTWNNKLTQRNTELENQLDMTTQKLDIAEQKLKPPPPPPPPPLPPGGFLKPLHLLIKKKKVDTPKSDPKDAREKNYQEALNEMMKRIQNGRKLLPANERRRQSLPERSKTLNPSLPTSPNSDGAMGELNKMLHSMKMRSHSVPSIQTPGHGFVNSGNSPEMTELIQTFQRIQKGKMGTAPPDVGVEGPGRNLSLIEEVEEKESLSSQKSSEKVTDKDDEVFV